MLADEDELLHAVAVLLVPVALQARILLLEELQLVFGHRGVPLAGLTNAHLLAGLLEHVAGVAFVVEIADALGTDDALGPFAGYELIEESQIEGTATVVDVGADAVFLGFALIVMVVVMMVMAVLVMFVVK